MFYLLQLNYGIFPEAGSLHDPNGGKFIFLIAYPPCMFATPYVYLELVHLQDMLKGNKIFQ